MKKMLLHKHNPILLFRRSKLIKIFSMRNVNRPYKVFQVRSASSKSPVNNISQEMIRNIGIMAHIDAGKTTTTERMLLYAGYIKHVGNVDDGDTVMDYMIQERDRGITITSAAITFLWKKHRINLIDTPGHVDFTLEVERSLRVLDGAIAVLDASAGVEAQTLTVWRQADRYDIPRIAYLNKMDKPAACYETSIRSMVDKLHIIPLIIQIPVNSGPNFEGVVDLISMEKLSWSGNKKDKGFEITELSSENDKELYEKALAQRMKLIESLVDLDDSIAEYFLADTDQFSIPKVTIHNAIRRACLNLKGVPILCGSSYKNKGVQPLMDAVVKYLPNPLDIKHNFLDYYKDELCGMAFKLVHDKHHGPLTFVRLYSGKINSGGTVYNVNRQQTEKVARLLQVYADEHKEVDYLYAGNIAAVSGLKYTYTGDTLVTNLSASKSARRKMNEKKDNPDDPEDSSPVLAGLVVPDPVFFCSIEVASLVYQKQFDLALENLTKEDPSLRVHIDQDTGQTILSGMGELHLDIIKSRIENEYKIEVDLGPLQISYRETIIGKAAETVSIDKMIGKDRHRVTVSLSVKPSESANEVFDEMHLEPNQGSNFDPKRIKRATLKAINAGVKSALTRGPTLGFPVLGVSVTLQDLIIGYGTSIPMITGCASQAVYQAIKHAQPTLLEPVMNMEIHTDYDYLSSVLSDLSPRRCQIKEITAHQSNRSIFAIVPLSELMGYSTTLRTITSGTGIFSMELSHYEQMNEIDQRKAIEQVTGFAPL